MAKYKIGGIVLDFVYLFNDYFKDRIDKYLIEDDCEVDARMHVREVEFIQEPSTTLELESTYKKMFYDGTLYHLCYYTKDYSSIKTLARYDEGYKNVEIEMVVKDVEQAAEFEYITTGLFFLSMAFSKNHLSLHASAIAHKQEAILFSAPSQTGKSTHAKLWMKYVEDVTIINDDKPLLMFDEHQILVSGSPWSGKTSQNENIQVPIKAIIFLHQGIDNKIEEMTNQEKITYIMRNVHRPHEVELQDVLFQQLENLVEKVPMVRYYVNRTKEAVELLYQYLYKGE